MQIVHFAINTFESLDSGGDQLTAESHYIPQRNEKNTYTQMFVRAVENEANNNHAFLDC